MFMCVWENRGVTVACNVSYLFFPHRSPVWSVEDSSDWFVWAVILNIPKRRNCWPTYTNMQKYTQILSIYTRRLILLLLPLQHLASTPSMHQSEERPKQPLWTVYHLYYFITFLRVFPNLILLHCHQMMSSLICCSLLFSSLLFHKFIDLGSWCMTAVVDADRSLDLVSSPCHV